MPGYNPAYGYGKYRLAGKNLMVIPLVQNLFIILTAGLILGIIAKRMGFLHAGGLSAGRRVDR